MIDVMVAVMTACSTRGFNDPTQHSGRHVHPKKVAPDSSIRMVKGTSLLCIGVMSPYLHHSIKVVVAAAVAAMAARVRADP